MQTIVYQGKPGEGDPHWHPLPVHSVQSYRNLGYQVRELVLRTDAEQAEISAFDNGLQLAARMAEQTDPALAAQIRELIEQPEVAA